MNLRERLRAFILTRLKEADRSLPGELRNDTSLLRSGVLDSLALLALAQWIETEVGISLDLTDLNVVEEWDTIDRIVQFIEKRRGATPS